MNLKGNRGIGGWIGGFKGVYDSSKKELRNIVFDPLETIWSVYDSYWFGRKIVDTWFSAINLDGKRKNYGILVVKRKCQFPRKRHNIDLIRTFGSIALKTWLIFTLSDGCPRFSSFAAMLLIPLLFAAWILEPQFRF